MTYFKSLAPAGWNSRKLKFHKLRSLYINSEWSRSLYDLRLLWSSRYNLRLRRVRPCVRIPHTTCFFSFSNSKIFYDLVSISRLPTVAWPIESPYQGYYQWLGEKISLKFLLIGEVDVCPTYEYFEKTEHFYLLFLKFLASDWLVKSSQSK